MKRLLFISWLIVWPLCTRAEDIAIIVAKECKLQSITLAELRAILRLDKRVSPAGAKWLVTLRSKTSPEHRAMLQQVYNSGADDLESYFKLGEFNGSFDPAPKSISSSVLLQRIIASNVSAIGYVRVSEIGTEVKILRIDGVLPGQENYPLKTPR